MPTFRSSVNLSTSLASDSLKRTLVFSLITRDFVWTCDAVAALMKRPDIIRRAFRGTGVGIDIEGKMKDNLRFPGFDTYVPPEKDEEHLNDLLTKEEIEETEKREAKFQAKKKKRKRKEREEKK